MFVLTSEVEPCADVALVRVAVERDAEHVADERVVVGAADTVRVLGRGDLDIVSTRLVILAK